MYGKMVRHVNYMLSSCQKLIPLHYPFFPKTDSEVKRCELRFAGSIYRQNI